MTDKTRVLLRPALVPIRITRRPDEPDERRFTTSMEAPIFLDDLGGKVSERECYAALASIPWLHEKIRTAIRHYGLSRDVKQDDAAIAKEQTQIYRDTIARFKRKGEKRPFQKLAVHTDKSITRCRPMTPKLDKATKALKRRLSPDRTK
jgi:hypothetical protein